MERKCEFAGCKCPARFIAHKLFGSGGTLLVCAKHKPGSRPRPASLAHLPPYYRVEALKP